MARSRNIKPGFFKNEELAELPFETRLLFAGLWCLADREGRMEDRPKRIRAEVFPYDLIDCDPLLDQLHATGFIVRYEVDGSKYIEIPSFLVHQNPHKNEADSDIPKKECGKLQKLRESSGTAPVKLGSAPADSLIPDSLIPDSLSIPSSAAPSEAVPLAKAFEKIQRRWFEEEFWPVVWRKVDKEAAFKAFKKHATSETRKNEIVAAAKAHGPAYLCRDTEFRPHPATWLNKTRYLEEPEVFEFVAPKPKRALALDAMFDEIDRREREAGDKAATQTAIGAGVFPV